MSYYEYNHLDFDAEGNVLVKDNKVSAILDFDDLSYSPCIVCLGYTLWHVLFISNDKHLLEQYITDYIKTRSLAKEEYEILPKILLFRNYVIGMLELTVRRREKYIDHIMNLEKEILNMSFLYLNTHKTGSNVL